MPHCTFSVATQVHLHECLMARDCSGGECDCDRACDRHRVAHQVVGSLEPVAGETSEQTMARLIALSDELEAELSEDRMTVPDSLGALAIPGRLSPLAAMELALRGEV